jgi:hypothetical protein
MDAPVNNASCVQAQNECRNRESSIACEPLK